MKVSERFACRVTGQNRSTQRRPPAATTPASVARSPSRLGRRLAGLAQHTQVIVVTHLAQIAAFADRHYVVVKSDDGQVTTSGVVQVADEDRAVELARMMAGLDTTESALAHAGQLVELAASSRTSSN
jgi:DNA repair protein RecN (Recombination protein N)